jgi:hypothetical protein
MTGSTVANATRGKSELLAMERYPGEWTLHGRIVLPIIPGVIPATSHSVGIRWHKRPKRCTTRSKKSKGKRIKRLMSIVIETAQRKMQRSFEEQLWEGQS